ncbi:F-box domain-containing protein [Heracleum sosnowskyi]|uniref:F-box domain-containing protein n=1 Tax=Heracleum sosnowskyi TaxID=360622 RepID=A0AAD8HRX4_9APIA|nr:F-box domain-containing protein [Heracleum sosnowskyi]
MPPIPIDDQLNTITSKKKKKLRLPGFFQAQLRKLKSSKGKLSSKNYQIPNKISITSPWINYQITTSSNSNSSTCQVSKNKMTLFDNDSPVLKKHRNMMLPECKLGLRSINDLTEDLLAEILKLLPVKYILRCRCVQKSWYYLVKSDMFITLELNYQKMNHSLHPKYLFFENAYTGALTLRYDDVHCQEYCTPKYPLGLSDKFAWRALSYGLICVSTMLTPLLRFATQKIYLWNPLVQKYKTLPDSPISNTETQWKALAFGFVPEINDYIVVHIVKPCLHLGHGKPDPHSVVIGVYSLNTNSWRKICQDKVFVRRVDRFDIVFINGAAFWTGVSLNKHKIILCYDTKTDILREISLPKWVSHSAGIPILHVFGQSIAYFVWEYGYDYFDMWILKYVSVNEFSWEKKMSISPNYKDIRVEVLGVRNNGEPILARSYNLISYNLDNHMAKDFLHSWNSWIPYPYYEEGFAPPFFIRPFVESLVLLNVD